MSMRVATFATSHSLLSAAMRVQARQAEITVQESSGLTSSDYGGLGAASGKVVSLESSIARSKAFATAASTADEQVTQMYDAVDSMVDLLTNFKADVISLDETLTDDETSTLVANAADTLDRLVSLMNSRYAGRYLFSGSAVDSAPVDLDGVATPTVPSSADVSYYQGDDQAAAVRVAGDRTVSYGVTADDAAFEKAIRALSLVAAGNSDADTLAEAADLVDAAIGGLTTVQSGLSLDAATLEDSVSEQEGYQSFATTLVGDLTNVDVAQAAADMSTYQTQLEAAYAAIGKIQTLSLSQYLD